VGCSAAPDEGDGDEPGQGPAGCSAKAVPDVKAYWEANSCSDEGQGPAGCSAAPDEGDGDEPGQGPAGCSAKREP
jgi:hypothetical protein